MKETKYQWKFFLPFPSLLFTSIPFPFLSFLSLPFFPALPFGFSPLLSSPLPPLRSTRSDFTAFLPQAAKNKALEKDKKARSQHDTLMGSIAVAASVKGFLKEVSTSYQLSCKSVLSIISLFIKQEANFLPSD